MKIIILILAGLSAYMLGVLVAVLKKRRRKTEVSHTVTAHAACDETVNRLNLEYRNFLNYDGSVQT